MPLIFFLFLALFIGLWAMVHWLVWQVLVTFLPLGAAAKRVLLAVLALSVVSFPLITFLIRISANSLTKALYYTNSLWLGVINYIFLACLASGLIYLGSRLARLRLNMAAVLGVLLVLAIGLAVFGWWQARHPIVTRLTVPIKDLPPAWAGKTIAQLSDVHLGAILDAEYMARLTAAINAESVEAVFFTGDYFDGSCLDLDRLAAPLAALDPPQGSYFITGNHETYIGAERIFAAIEKTGVQVLDNELVDLNGLKVLGLSYAESGDRPDRKTIFARLDPSDPTILLDHSPTHIAEARAAGVRLQLSGHTHWGQLWPYGYITRLIFGRYHRGLNTEGDYSVYTSAGAGTWGPPGRVGAPPEIVLITLSAK